MPAPTLTATERPPVREALLRSRRGVLSGFGFDRLARYVFQINAGISIVVLALITFTIFRDAVGFIPQNQANLAIYRLAGLEYTDYLRRQVEDYAALSRYLAGIRSGQLESYLQQGVSPAAVTGKLADFDAYANKLADANEPLETILGNLTDLTTSLKERQKVAQDMVEARAHLERALATAAPARAAELRKQREAMIVEKIDFTAEVQPLKAMRPEVTAANAALATALQDAAAHPPHVAEPALQRKVEKFGKLLDRYRAGLSDTTERMAAWNQARPVSWWESLQAFIFGRDWITASFWQDWYGVLPLFSGSLLISALALMIAIPLGVAAAVYVNQVATPLEQRVIKPTIEFVSAIPSVVLGFFGIAVLGETLRRVSQVAWLSWVPGFPMAERLNATTAACLLALMAVPTIFSLAEDAINNVPRSFKEASLALGATRLQTIVHITVPAALSGIMAAILLGFGRVIGETMVVLLCAGNRIQTPDFTSGLGAIFQPVHTMTGIIAQEMGEVVRDSLHYRALFMVGVVLFLIALLVNWLAQKIVHRYRIAIG